jgi:UDP-N-acetyl-D-galactosamine dehydrogenase
VSQLPSGIIVVGVGYVGLPLAAAFGRHLPTLAFDVSKSRIEELQRGHDRNAEIDLTLDPSPQLEFSSDVEDLKRSSFIIVTVPTPVDQAKRPDFHYLESASNLVGSQLTPGTTVVFESTVYPGCTEEVCLPVLERASGLKAGRDFFLGYSPERINPGDLEHTLETTYKIVAGQDAQTTELLAQVYGVVNGGLIFQAANIKTAEAAKVIENTQRDLNIALINELSMLFHELDINTRDVLAAAGTKWNFLKFYPGLVGGHCIPVDPYYLTHKAEMTGYHPQIILAGRRINDRMPAYVASQLVRVLCKQRVTPFDSATLVLGATFKENVRDLRNSMALRLVGELNSFEFPTAIYDPIVDPRALPAGLNFVTDPFQSAARYSVLVLAVGHRVFRERAHQELFSLLDQEGPSVIVDLTGTFTSADEIPDRTHLWQL